jgi:hypothetical protein
MTTLRTATSCEIDDLIDAIREKTNKSYDEVETAMDKAYLFPESKKTYVDTQFRNDDEKDNQWLYDVIYDIMDDNKISSMYITTAI